MLTAICLLNISYNPTHGSPTNDRFSTKYQYITYIILMTDGLQLLQAFILKAAFVPTASF